MQLVPSPDVRYRGWGVSLAVMARRMRDESYRQDQRAHLMDSHIKPINKLVERHHGGGFGCPRFVLQLAHHRFNRSRVGAAVF